MNNKTTKRTLVSSVVALLICFTMLIGTTYAWFTDVVTSSDNIIKTGILDAAVTWTDDFAAAEDTWNDVEDPNTEAIFNYELWEPGYVAVRYLKVANVGTLAFKYKLVIITNGSLEDKDGVKLSDVIDVYYAPSKVDVPNRDLDNNPNLTKVGTLSDLITGTSVVNGVLLAGQTDSIDYGTIVLKMQESAGNEYQDLAVGTSFDLMLFATQYTYEEDSFDHLYDEGADFPKFGTGSAPIVEGSAGVDIEVRNDAGYKVASVTVTKESYATDESQIDVIITESDYVPNITIAAGRETETVDVKVTGIKPGNTAPIKVEYRIATGLDPATVKVYHYDTEIVGINDLPDYKTTYDPSTGYVTFYTTSFSPYTIEYDKDSVYVPPVTDPDELPVAIVVGSPEYENVDLPWGNFGGFAPTEGLDNHLESAFTFSCAHTAEQAKASPYADWHCDFYVKLDKDLGANEIFLGGNYGDFGWVGFHNGDLTLDANTEIPLLGSVTTNPWTYADIVSFVGTFICGVGDVNDALAGATFTVMLRLTNPADATDFHDVATITHVFEDNRIYNAADLQTAVNAGGKVVLGADVNMNGAALQIPENSEVTLDLNGYTITSKDGGQGNWMAVKVNRGANFTLNDSKGTGKIVSSCYGVYVNPGATFTMNGGTISVSGNGAYDMGVVVWNGKFVMNAGTVEGKYSVYASDYWKNNGDTTCDCEIIVANGCTLNALVDQVNTAEAPTAIVSVPSGVVVNSTVSQ